MKRFPLKRDPRRGAIVPLVALLLVPLLALLAFSVDMGYIVVVKSELHKAADAAALAGAAELLVPQMAGNINTNALASSGISLADTEAKKFSLLNKAGGVSLNLLDSDIVVGYQASASNAAALSQWTTGTSYPNMVQVTLRRDSTANGTVGLFFARAIGNSTWSGTATATAYAGKTYNVTGFNSLTNNATLLPIAIDVSYWNTLMSSGKSPDGTVHDNYKVVRPTSSVTGSQTVTSTSDNIPEFTDAYGNKNSPGNFGLVSIGPAATSDPAFANWILNGSSPSDMASFGSNGIQATPSSPLTMAGGPGLKSNLVSDLASTIGQPRAVPLFSSYSGNGSNTTYTIVGFAGVTVVGATGSGSNIQVTLQPTVLIDPTATTSTSGSSGSYFIAPTSPLELVR